MGCARIATEKVVPALQQSNHCTVTAIASRSKDKAQSWIRKLDIPKAYGSYEELLCDPDIDIIYNPLPNHLHIPWSIKAIEAGKHVLCEKPIAVSSSEAQRLLEISQTRPQIKVMEAFMYRFHPQWQKAVELVQIGAIGKLQTIQSAFSYYNDNPLDIRFTFTEGGGCLWDLGCYPVSLSRLLFQREPERVCSTMSFDPAFNIDCLTSGMLDFGNGTSTFTCSIQMAYYQRVNIFGTAGRIEIEIPFNAPPNRPCKMWLHKESNREEIIFDICDQYTIQGDKFAQAVINNTEVPYPLEDAVANMKVLDALVDSAKSNRWIGL